MKTNPIKLFASISRGEWFQITFMAVILFSSLILSSSIWFSSNKKIEVDAYSDSGDISNQLDTLNKTLDGGIKVIVSNDMVGASIEPFQVDCDATVSGGSSLLTGPEPVSVKIEQ
jgi:hypothetical protein